MVPMQSNMDHIIKHDIALFILKFGGIDHNKLSDVIKSSIIVNSSL